MPSASALAHTDESSREQLSWYLITGTAARFCIVHSSRFSAPSGPASMWEWLRGSAKLQFHSARDSMLESAGCLRGKRHPGRCFQSGHVRRVHLSGDFLAARPSDPAVPSCTEIEDEIFVPGVLVPPFADGLATRGLESITQKD